MHHLRLLLTTVLLVTGLLANSARAGGWERVTKEEGIAVDQKQLAGSDLPVFRGRGVIQGNIYQVLAVLQDVSRHTEWMHKCAEARLLERINPKERYVYNRTDAPWPISDRDMVLHSRLEIIEPGEQIHSYFQLARHPSVGKTDAVRVVRLKGHYKLKALGSDRTFVEYQVASDPGGSLPDWIVKRATRELPLHTLRNLRDQVRKTKGRYRRFIQQWSAQD